MVHLDREHVLERFVCGMTDTRRKIALLSNITVGLIVGKLCRKYELYVPEGFDTWIQEAVNPASVLYSGCYDAVVILLDGMEARSWKDRTEAEERLTMWKQAVSAIAGKIMDIPVFVTTIDLRENRIKSLAERKYRIELESDWYQFVQGKAEETDNIYVIDLADTIADIGRKTFYSNKMWYMSSMPYSRDGLNAVVDVIDQALNSAFGERKKIIALDLDNTLWGGVVGEDGVDGLELSDHKEGQRFYDFQRQLLEMKKRGILLAVNSKNNLEDAGAAIQGHPSMLLRENDFVSRKINWENKAVNLKEIEAELNLSESGFLFIDDNPAERESVKSGCPEVVVPDFPGDTAELLTFAEELWLDFCRPLRVLGEDLKKTEMYRDEARRRQDINESLNLDDYLEKLEMTADIHRMRPEELGRVAQLCNKTNQFNVTTRRYTQAELRAIADNPDDAVYVAHSADKYGDSGLVSVIILRDCKDNIMIDTFLMSCRVMGRKLENVIIDEIANQYKSRKRLIGEYIPTEKNIPVRNLYDRLGFRLLSDEDGHRVYELDMAAHKKMDLDAYKEIIFNS